MQNKKYIVIETADVEIISLRIFNDRNDADTHFNKCRDDNHEIDWEEIPFELEGTLRGAGDDSYSIQMIEREVE